MNILILCTIFFTKLSVSLCQIRDVENRAIIIGCTWILRNPPTKQTPPVSQGLFFVEASRSHSDTPHSVGLLWTSEWHDSETPSWQHATFTEIEIYPPGGIRIRSPSKRSAADLLFGLSVSVIGVSVDYLYDNPYLTAFPYGNGMVLHFYQQQESSTTKTVHKVINKRLKTYV